MKSDIEIARSIELKKIKQVAESVDIPRDGRELWTIHSQDSHSSD